ncbi:MAG: hypothetical protein HKM06_01800 [Spirochaetales bacterium]|nr:hypothetical protein [Spirochaetales bacterium]
MTAESRMLLVLCAVFLILGCQSPTTTASNSNSGGAGTATSLKGTLYDGSTSAPLAGATVYWGSQTATTVSDGTFSIPLSQNTGTLTADFGISKPGYKVVFFQSMPVDAGNPPVVSFDLSPLVSTTSNSVTITLKLTDQNGVELPAGTPICFTVAFSGGSSSTTATYSTGGSSLTMGGSGFTSTSSVRIDELSSTTQFPIATAWMSNVNLSGPTANLGTVQLTTNPDVTFTGGSSASVYYETSNNNVLLSTNYSPLSGAVPVAAPPASTLVAVASHATFNTSDGYMGINDALGAEVSSLSSNMTLPTLTGSPITGGPAVAPTYSSGTLTLSAVSGANLYQVLIVPANGSSTFSLSLVSANPTIVLPAWVTAAVAGSQADVSTSVENFSLDTQSFFEMALHDIPLSNVSFSTLYAYSGTGSNNLDATLQF